MLAYGKHNSVKNLRIGLHKRCICLGNNVRRILPIITAKGREHKNLLAFLLVNPKGIESTFTNRSATQKVQGEQCCFYQTISHIESILTFMNEHSFRWRAHVSARHIRRCTCDDVDMSPLAFGEKLRHALENLLKDGDVI